jgi:hypothetical protein
MVSRPAPSSRAIRPLACATRIRIKKATPMFMIAMHSVRARWGPPPSGYARRSKIIAVWRIIVHTVVATAQPTPPRTAPSSTETGSPTQSSACMSRATPIRAVTASERKGKGRHQRLPRRQQHALAQRAPGSARGLIRAPRSDGDRSSAENDILALLGSQGIVADARTPPIPATLVNTITMVTDKPYGNGRTNGS